MVRKVAANVFIPFTVGGGIRTVDDFRKLLREGADKISVNSAAIDLSLIHIYKNNKAAKYQPSK